MAEKVQGSFVFTVLDKDDSIWFVRGDNPLSIFCYDGFLIYASTADILRKVEYRVHIQHKRTIQTKEGDILKIDRYGKESRSTFIPHHSFEHFWRSFPYNKKEEAEELELLFEMGKLFGVTPEEVQMLLDYGCDIDEIQDLFYEPELLRRVLTEFSYSYL